jgi:hypothetical protein
MKTFQQLMTINERFVNLIGNDQKKSDYAEELYDILQKSYEPIGGIHGSGFENSQSMIEKIPFWKLAVKDGKIVAAILYKDKQGRKSVAVATDQSTIGKQQLANIIFADFSRAYIEVSSKMLSFLKKNTPTGFLNKNAIAFEKVQQLVKDDEIRRPSPNDEEIKRHPELRDFFYQREIGGQWHTKIMLGAPGKNIRMK